MANTTTICTTLMFSSWNPNYKLHQMKNKTSNLFSHRTMQMYLSALLITNLFGLTVAFWWKDLKINTIEICLFSKLNANSPKLILFQLWTRYLKVMDPWQKNKEKNTTFLFLKHRKNTKIIWEMNCLRLKNNLKNVFCVERTCFQMSFNWMMNNSAVSWIKIVRAFTKILP